MAQHRSHAARNREQRQRLEALVARLGEQDLAALIPNSEWSVSAALAHLAFWDRRALYSLEQWERQGTEGARLEADVVNFAALPQWLALPGTVAAQQAVDTARILDHKIEALPQWLIEAVMASELTFLIDRSNHRRQHLDQIDGALSG